MGDNDTVQLAGTGHDLTGACLGWTGRFFMRKCWAGNQSNPIPVVLLVRIILTVVLLPLYCYYSNSSVLNNKYEYRCICTAI